MGELTNLNSPKAIADADIPAEIARDSETAAAVAAHAAAIDPHPIYLTQAEGDASYPRFRRNIYSLLTGALQGSLSSTTHNIDATKIISFSSFVFINLSNSAGFTPRILPGGVASLAGYNYSLTIDMHNILCRLHATDSAQILSRPVSVSIDFVT